MFTQLHGRPMEPRSLLHLLTELRACGAAATAASCLPSQDIAIIFGQLHGRPMELRSPLHLETRLLACGAAAAAARCLPSQGIAVMFGQLHGRPMELRSLLHLLIELRACGAAAAAARCLPSQDIAIIFGQLHGRPMELRSPLHLETRLRACGIALLFLVPWSMPAALACTTAPPTLCAQPTKAKHSAARASQGTAESLPPLASPMHSHLHRHNQRNPRAPLLLFACTYWCCCSASPSLSCRAEMLFCGSSQLQTTERQAHPLCAIALCFRSIANNTKAMHAIVTVSNSVIHAIIAIDCYFSRAVCIAFTNGIATATSHALECCASQGRGPKRRLFCRANAAQQRHNDGLVPVDGQFEGCLAVTAGRRMRRRIENKTRQKQ
jgi:hypothetical protein